MGGLANQRPDAYPFILGCLGKMDPHGMTLTSTHTSYKMSWILWQSHIVAPEVGSPECVGTPRPLVPGSATRAWERTGGPPHASCKGERDGDEDRPWDSARALALRDRGLAYRFHWWGCEFCAVSLNLVWRFHWWVVALNVYMLVCNCDWYWYSCLFRC